MNQYGPRWSALKILKYACDGAKIIDIVWNHMRIVSFCGFSDSSIHYMSVVIPYKFSLISAADNGFTCSHVNDMIWKCFSQYWPFVREINWDGGFISQKASDVGLGCFLCCQPEQAVELTVKFLMIWDTVTPTSMILNMSCLVASQHWIKKIYIYIQKWKVR